MHTYRSFQSYTLSKSYSLEQTTLFPANEPEHERFASVFSRTLQYVKGNFFYTFNLFEKTNQTVKFISTVSHYFETNPRRRYT